MNKDEFAFKGLLLMEKSSIPLVSVCMVTFNQEKFILEALNSVLGQITSFSYEVIVSDDCSMDSTPSILADYASRFPGIVYPLFGKENLGYPNNQRRSLETARGKYIALCDGDDYWTDRYKLQKQIDYMENHPDCAICFHNVMNIYEDNQSPRSLFNPLDFPNELTCYDMISRKWFLPTNSEVFRREYLFFPEWYDSVLHIDYVLNLIISSRGSLHYMPDIMAVYRHTKQSVNKNHGTGKYDDMLFHLRTMETILTEMKDILPEEYCEVINQRIDFYEKEIDVYSREKFYEDHPFLKLFRIKTYKRAIKQKFRKLLNG